jgi:hypothetical protein
MMSAGPVYKPPGEMGGLAWGRVMRLPRRRIRRKRWQEAVIAKANLLEHEGKLLYQQDQSRSPDPDRDQAVRDAVLTAMKKHLQDARMAAGEAGKDGKVGEDQQSPA